MQESHAAHPTLDAARRDRLGRELGEGETVLWAEAPIWTAAIPGAALSLAFGAGVAFFVLTWVGFSVTVFIDAWFGANRSHTPPALAAAMIVVALPFVVLGARALWEPLRTLREARATIYAITDRRLLIVVDGAAGRGESIPPTGMRHITRRQAPVLGAYVSVTYGDEPDSFENVPTRALLCLRDAVAAERALRRLAAGPGTVPTPPVYAAPRAA